MHPKADHLCSLCVLQPLTHSGHSAALRSHSRIVLWTGRERSVRVAFGGSDDFAPLLGLFRNELPEVGGRALERRAPEFSELRLGFGISEARIDPLVERIDNLDGCVLRSAD